MKKDETRELIIKVMQQKITILHNFLTRFYGMAPPNSQVPPFMLVMRGEESEKDRPNIIPMQDYIDDSYILEMMQQAYKQEPGVNASIFVAEATVGEIRAGSELGKELAERLERKDNTILDDLQGRVISRNALVYIAEVPVASVYLTGTSYITRKNGKAVLAPVEIKESDEPTNLKGGFVNKIAA